MTEMSAYSIPFKYEFFPIQFLLINPRFYLARALAEERHPPPLPPKYSTNVPCQVNGCPGKEVDYPDALQCSLQVSLFIKTPWSHPLYFSLKSPASMSA
jgi:hypothetical protein